MTRICLLVLCLSMMGCGASLPDNKTLLEQADHAASTAEELCLLAHATNARLNTEPQLSVMRSKIDAVCDPALSALDTASASSAVRLLATLRDSLAELLR